MDRRLKITDHPEFAGDIPFVKARPAVEHQRADLLARLTQGVRCTFQPLLLIPGVDLRISSLHPPTVIIEPGGGLITLGDKDRKLTQLLRHGVHKIAIDTKLAVIALERGRQQRFVGDQRRVRAMSVAMQGKAVTVACPNRFENVAEILHPVTVGIAGVDRLRVPRGYRANQHQIIFMAGQAVDRLAAEAIAAGITLRRNHFALFDNRGARGADLS